MKKAILLSLLFSFTFWGCSQKQQIVFQNKLVCIEQQKIERIDPTQIRVYNDDLEVAKAYKTSIDYSLQFYENQVDRNNLFCKKEKEIK